MQDQARGVLYLEQIVALKVNSTQGSQQAVVEVEVYQRRHEQYYKGMTLLFSVHTQSPKMHGLTIQGSFCC